MWSGSFIIGQSRLFRFIENKEFNEANKEAVTPTKKKGVLVWGCIVSVCLWPCSFETYALISMMFFLKTLLFLECCLAVKIAVQLM